MKQWQHFHVLNTALGLSMAERSSEGCIAYFEPDPRSLLPVLAIFHLIEYRGAHGLEAFIAYVLPHRYLEDVV